jgi:hypothetical protein
MAKVYLAVPESYRKLLPAEAYCQAAGVSPYRVLELITGLAVRFGVQASTILTAVMLPRVVHKTIDRARAAERWHERAHDAAPGSGLPSASGLTRRVEQVERVDLFSCIFWGI